MKKKPLKIFVVSDTSHFALTDVYYGYVRAFEKLGIDYVSYPLHQYKNHHKMHMCMSVIHSEALLKRNGYTHVMFIGGLNIPKTLLESFHGVVKTIVVATEDPHSFKPMEEKLPHIDYYLTNEKAMLQLGRKNIHYMPTAGDNVGCFIHPQRNLEAHHHSDILFLGALYPNRVEMLEEILPVVKENFLNLKIMGHPHGLPKESPLYKYIPPENFDANGNIVTIPHTETVKYYNGAEVVLNFFRDTTWTPGEEGLVNPHNATEIVAESLNPRAYEVPLCGSHMFLESTRKEAREVFEDDEVDFFETPEDLKALTYSYFVKNNKYAYASRDKPIKANKALLKVSSKHTYTVRAQELIKLL